MGGKLKTVNDWEKHVKEIREFLDEDYNVTVPIKVAVSSYVDYQYGWARIGCSKFCSRVIPQLRGGDELADIIPHIQSAVWDAVSFGNSTIILDSSGNVRVSSPETSHAQKNVFGAVFYQETLADMIVRSVNGIMAMSTDDGKTWTEMDHVSFTLFYGADSSHPFGQSRITQSIRKNIRSASQSKIMMNEAARFRTLPMMVFNGLWEDFSDNVRDGISKLKSGVSNVLGLPKDPMTNEKVDITQIQAADFSPFILLKESYQKDVAASFNIEPSELGVTGSNPTSADALYATKEDLVIEITNWETSVHSVLQELVDAYAFIRDVEAPKLVFAEPATPSKASQADAFVKLASVIPQLKYSPAALQWAGLPNALIEDINAESAKWEAELKEAQTNEGV